MAENLHNDEILLQYLDRALSDEATTKLEQQLQEDPALQERLDSLKITAEAVKLFGIQQEVAYARRQWEQERSESKKTTGRMVSINRTLRYGLVAAACIMLVIVGVKYFWFPGVSSDHIYKELYVGYEPDRARSGNTTATPAEQAWRQGKYGAVINLERNGVQSDEDQLLLGLSYLQLNQPSAAIPVFQSMLRGNSNYREDAEFYLGLAYLKNHNNAEALAILQKIENDPAHIYHQQVTEKALSEIRRLK